jgi:hypothetical protein
MKTCPRWVPGQFTFTRQIEPALTCLHQPETTTSNAPRQTDWPSTLRHRITSKDSTDTFIEQVQFTDSSGKARRKRIVYQYMQMNNPIDFQTALWVTKRFCTWLTANPFSDKASPLLGNRRDQKNDRFASVVKLSIIRGRTSINWPSNNRDQQTRILSECDLFPLRQVSNLTNHPCLTSSCYEPIRNGFFPKHW